MNETPVIFYALDRAPVLRITLLDPSGRGVVLDSCVVHVLVRRRGSRRAVWTEASDTVCAVPNGRVVNEDEGIIEYLLPAPLRAVGLYDVQVRVERTGITVHSETFPIQVLPTL